MTACCSTSELGGSRARVDPPSRVWGYAHHLCLHRICRPVPRFVRTHSIGAARTPSISAIPSMASFPTSPTSSSDPQGAVATCVATQSAGKWKWVMSVPALQRLAPATKSSTCLWTSNLRRSFACNRAVCHWFTFGLMQRRAMRFRKSNRSGPRRASGLGWRAK